VKVITTTILALATTGICGCYHEPPPPLVEVAFPLDKAGSTVEFSFTVKPDTPTDRSLMLAIRYPHAGTKSATDTIERLRTPVLVDLEEVTPSGRQHVEVLDGDQIAISNGYPPEPMSAPAAPADAKRLKLVSHNAEDTDLLIGRFRGRKGATYEARVTSINDIPELTGVPVTLKVDTYFNTGT
jgi:hypothetical protein